MSLCVLSLPMRFWVNILRNPHFIFDVHVTEVVDASLHVIAQTFMDACTKTEHKLSRVRISPFKERHVCNPVNVSEREAIWAIFQLQPQLPAAISDFSNFLLF